MNCEQCNMEMKLISSVKSRKNYKGLYHRIRKYFCEICLHYQTIHGTGELDSKNNQDAITEYEIKKRDLQEKHGTHIEDYE